MSHKFSQILQDSPFGTVRLPKSLHLLDESHLDTLRSHLFQNCSRPQSVLGLMEAGSSLGPGLVVTGAPWLWWWRGGTDLSGSWRSSRCSWGSCWWLLLFAVGGNNECSCPGGRLMYVLCPPMAEAEALGAHTSCGVFLDCDQDGTMKTCHTHNPPPPAELLVRRGPVDVNSCYVFL